MSDDDLQRTVDRLVESTYSQERPVSFAELEAEVARLLGLIKNFVMAPGWDNEDELSALEQALQESSVQGVGMSEKPNEFASQLCIDRGCQVVEGRIEKQDAEIARLQQQKELAYKEVEIQVAKVARLREAIEQHNSGLDMSCANQKGLGRCDDYNIRKRDCPDCPRDFRIDLKESGNV